MSRARAAALGCALLASAVLLPGVSRSDPAPAAPAAGATPRGVVGAAQLDVNFTNPAGRPMAFTGNMAFEQGADRSRIDITALSLASGNATAVQILPGPLTLVLNRTTQRYVIWSSARRTYFVGDVPKPPSPLGAPSAPPRPTPAPARSAPPKADTSPFAGLKNLKAFSIGADLSGHGTTIGHPSTGFTYHLHTETNDGKVNDLNGELQTADDLGGLPLLFTLKVAAQSGLTGTLRAEVTSIDRRDPPASAFLLPAGYKLVKNPLEVILGNASPMHMPMQMPAPAPAPKASPPA